LLLIAVTGLTLLTSVSGELVSDELKRILPLYLGPYYRPFLWILFTFLALLTLYFEWRRHCHVRDTQPLREPVKTPEPSRELVKTPEPYQPTQAEQQQLKAFWPKLSETLARDLPDSLQSTIVARIAANADTRPGLVDTHNPELNSQLTGSHWNIISKCEPNLFQALTKYVQASDRLRSAAHRYRQFGYSSGTENGDLESAKKEMRRAARDLEDAIDSLNGLVRYYNDVFGASE
jgi:hypothetical protein